MKRNFVQQLHTLPEIFKGNIFYIPDYQRGYAWDSKQVNDLLDDVENTLLNKSFVRHYTGTLVLSKKENENEYNIVDGQQRLTTLVIFLKCISLFCNEEVKNSITDKYIKRGSVGNERFILKLNTDTRCFFEKVILSDANLENSPISLESHERLWNSYNQIKKWLHQKKEKNILIEDIIHSIENDFGFIVYSPKEDTETGVMFEVINNRGKQLSELEKVKNYLIYCSIKLSASTLRNDITENWSDILQSLNKAKKTSANDESSFLRYCLVVFFKMNKTDSQYGYEVLKSRLDINKCLKKPLEKESVINRLQEFIQFLKLSAKWYERLYSKNYEGLDGSTILLIEKIRAQNVHASIMPLFLAINIKNKGKGVVSNRHLEVLEKLNFRVYMANNMTYRKDTGQGDLYQYASKYYHGNLKKNYLNDSNIDLDNNSIENDDQMLEYLLVNFTQSYAHDGWFKESFLLDEKNSFDFYKWRGIRYFLINYESYLQENKTINIDKILKSRNSGKTNDYLSLEHIWATENRSDDNSREKDHYQKRRLGNFVLLELRLNIQGNNDDAWIKMDRYLDGYGEEASSDLQHVKKAGKTIRKMVKSMDGVKKTVNYYYDLYDKIIDKQEQDYVEFAMKRWSLKGYLGYKRYKEVDEE